MSKKHMISDLCNISDCLHVTPEYTNVGIPMVRVTEINNSFLELAQALKVSTEDYDKYTVNYIPQRGDIILARVGAFLGEFAYVDTNEKFCIGQNTTVLNPKKHNKYIYYNLISPLTQVRLQREASGSAYKSVGVDTIKNFIIELPDDEVQTDKIGELLFSLDNKIQLNNRIIAELEAMAKTIYDYWFVQFDFPNAEGKPYCSSGGEMVWNKQLKQEIPKGWRDTTLSSFIKEEKGGDWGKEQITDDYTEKVICIRGADIPGLVGKQLLNAPTRYILKKNMDKALSDGAIIVEISGGSPTQSTGRVSYINEEVLSRFDIPIITSNFCKAFSLTNQDWQYWFYVLWEKLYSAGVFFKYEGKTTGIKNLLFDMLCSDYCTICPDADIISRYNDLVKPFFVYIQKKNLENLELIKLRDWLLPMLMNGQVTVD